MPYALCPMPYAVRVPHLSEKGYNKKLQPITNYQLPTINSNT